ncbi:MAG: hypothetical protein JWN13_5295 [Betaproteobacteria bacterium]|nr:hypothetical protein [Betaproteobacteria bacterium]
MRYGLVVLSMLFCWVPSAVAQVSIGIGLPGASIGINLSLFPELVPVPGYPVYYAPRLDSNFFFYDGMYWVYQRDNWYASTWYNGPWQVVAPEVVPLFILRIPVRYYRNPPPYFRGWRSDTPPRWSEHWGREWEQRRRGWDKWNRKSAPAPAPLPVYQRQYSGDRYPRVEQQQALRNQNYHYQPRDAVVRQHYQEQGAQRASTPPQQAPQDRSPRQQDMQRSNSPPPLQQGSPSIPRSPPPQRAGEDVQRAAPPPAPREQRGPSVEDQRQQPPQRGADRDQQPPRSRQETIPQGKGPSQEPRREQAQEKGREKGEERGQERNR